MSDLKTQIRTYFESIAPQVQVQPEQPEQPEPWWRMRPVMAWAIGAAVVAIPTLVLWGLFGRSVEPETTIPPATTVTTVVETTLPPETTVTTATPTTVTTQPTTTVAPEPAVRTIGDWIPIADGPWAYRDTIRAWTGTELLVFPEYASGLEAPEAGIAYNPTTQEWRELTPMPELRSQSAVAWTGQELIIWGGTIEFGERYVLSNDGFAYDPATDSWTSIAPSPLEPQTYPFHVWTGQELIIWGGSAVVDDIFIGGTTTGSAYNPETDQWRVLADSPLGSRNPGVGVWTGTEMIIGGNGDQTDGDASWAAYDPSADSWTELPDPPVRAGGVYRGVWTGTEVIFDVGDGSGGPTPRSEIYAFNPVTNEWRQAAAPNRSLFQTGSVWTGDYVIYWGEAGYPGTPLTEVAYDPETDEWTQLSESPLSDRFAHQATTLIGPDTVLIWGGGDYGPNGFSDGAILSIESTSATEPSVTATDLISSLFPLAGDPSLSADVLWDPSGVGLGLGESIFSTADPVDLVDPATWVLDVPLYNGAAGPFSILDAIGVLTGTDDIWVQEGPHDHCASPPKPAPAGMELLRRVSVQPSSFDSCLQWWTIDLFVNADGTIRAITYDFWEP